MILGQLCHPDIFYLNVRKKIIYQGEFNSKMKNMLFIEEVYSGQCMHDKHFYCLYEQKNQMRKRIKISDRQLFSN